jgi:hypothetical protein
MPSFHRRITGARARPTGLAREGFSQSEHTEQRDLFTWAILMQRQYRELEVMYAIPNGAFLGADRKAAWKHGARLVAEGLRRGMLDVCLPVSRGGYLTLYIEMKAGKNDTSPAQDQWCEALHRHGHLCVICWNFETARSVIIDYLEGKLVKPPEGECQSKSLDREPSRPSTT